MTNREWLNTLSNEDYTRWIFEHSSIYRVDTRSQTIYYDSLYPRLREVYATYVPGDMRFLDWLKQDRIDYSKGIKIEEIIK